MATMSESVGGLLGQFSFIFIFLLVFSILFGLLSYVNPMKDEKRGIYAIISFVIAVLVAISSSAVTFIRTMTVWFFVLALFVFLMLFVFGMFGLKESNWQKIIGDSNVYTWIIIIAIVIVLFSLGSAFGQRLLEKGSGTDTGTGTGTGTVEPTPTTTAQEGSFADNAIKTIINPKVLGLILVFAISLFMILFLTRL
jgi:hypothetical protein